MKKIISCFVCFIALAVSAQHYGPRHVHHAPPMHHHHHYSAWGHVGCNFWPGFVGGVVAGSLFAPRTYVAPVVTTPVVTTPVVTTPVVVQQPVAPVQTTVIYR